jgi:two-component system sensor histidine kinase PhoQ
MVSNGVAVFDFFLLSDLKPLTSQIDDYRFRLWGGLAVTALLLLVVQISVSRWALKPLKSVSKELNAIESGVNMRIEGNYPREVQRLTDNINTLLTQERDRQTRYRNALDNLAHSLKTPLAVLLAAVDETDNLPKVVQEQASRMRLTLERQLQRAGNASALAIIPSINLSHMVTRISASLSKVYGQKNITVINWVPDELNILCDEADMMEILGNLLDNAFKWCHSRIEIYATGSLNHFTINIHDDGSGISSDQISHVLKRGVRADESVPGTGIGLSLVADLVEAYQGRLRIERSRLGGAAVFIELMQLIKR